MSWQSHNSNTNRVKNRYGKMDKVGLTCSPKKNQRSNKPQYSSFFENEVLAEK
jgi:hypothetical protein